MTRHITIPVSIVVLLAVQAASPSLADDTDKLVGTWKLVSAVSEDLATGQKTNIYKGTPIEFIAYGADGRVMTIIVTRPVRSRRGSQQPLPRLRRCSDPWPLTQAATSSMETRLSIAPTPPGTTWTGTDQVRDYKLDGERLMLATAPSPNPFTGQMSVRTLTWEKVK